MKNKPLKIVALSDTHDRHWNVKVPRCDIFIFAGDANIVSYKNLEDFNNWIGTIDANHKILIGGNHCSYLEKIGKDDCQLFFNNAIYLENESVEIQGIKIWGSPYSVEYNGWSFMGSEIYLRDIWNLIPKNTDIIITHCPCYGILDVETHGGTNRGSITLKEKIKDIQPKIHICGHLHSAHGKYTDYKTDYYNVAILNDNYQLEFEPTIIKYEK